MHRVDFQELFINRRRLLRCLVLNHNKKKKLIYEEYFSMRSSGSRDCPCPSSACVSRPNNITDTDELYIKITSLSPSCVSLWLRKHKITQLSYVFWSLWLIKTDFYAFYIMHCHARDTHSCICVAIMQIFNDISRFCCRYKALKSSIACKCWD